MLLFLAALLGVQPTVLASLPVGDPLTLFAAPPRVEKMVARRTFKDGTEAYVLLRYDNGNFIVKTSRSKTTLERKILAAGDDIAGRWNNTVWVSHGGEGPGYLRIIDVNEPASANQTVSQHQMLTRLLCDHVSRLGRSLLTFGVDVPLEAHVVTRNGTFSFRDGDYSVEGMVKVEPAHHQRSKAFIAKWQKRLVTSDGLDVRYYECRGELSADTWIPQWVEIWDVSQPSRKRIGRADVLEAVVSKTPLSEKLFTVEGNVQSGIHGILVSSNQSVVVLPYGDGVPERTDRKHTVFGHVVSPKAFRAAVVVLMAVVTIGFAIAIMIHQKPKNK